MFISEARADFAWTFMSGTELPAGYPELSWSREVVSPSLAADLLSGVRIKLLTLVTSANAAHSPSACSETLPFLSIEPMSIGNFYPAKLACLCRKPNPGLLNWRSFPTTCWQSITFRGV